LLDNLSKAVAVYFGLERKQGFASLLPQLLFRPPKLIIADNRALFSPCNHLNPKIFAACRGPLSRVSTLLRDAYRIQTKGTTQTE
jgi:hypothetical protein